MKVLIIQQKMIGDVLTTSILLEALKTKFPGSDLHYLINTHTYPVVENNPFVDEFVFYTPEVEKSKKELWQLANSIRKQQYDIVIDAYSKLSSNLISVMSGAQQKISKHKWYTAFLYDRTIKYRTVANSNAGLAIENRMQLLAPLDVELANKTFKPKIYLTDSEREKAYESLLKSNIDPQKPLFMISVLGSGSLKTYPLQYMAQVIDQIVEHASAQILFNYMPKQTEEAKTVYGFCKPETQRFINMHVFGSSLRDFLSLTSHCNALIGNEGGAVNMAKALDVPTFTIFSPWIDKETWNIFENERNVSVHLKDFLPEVYANRKEKDFKKQALSLYEKFKPSYFSDTLKSYLDTILN